MTTKYIQYIFTAFTTSTLLLFVGCERDLDDDLPLATYPDTAEIFTDTPVGLGSDFYFPYSGSKATAWSLDTDVAYEGSVSMRFDVPNADDAAGSYAGAIFRIDGVGRDLSGYDALTFWAKASQGATIAEFGFGEDFIDNLYMTTLYDTRLSTTWQKYVIPIPDPSKLINERGVLRYSAAGIDGNAFTFWMDEVKFERLGTIAHQRPIILNGQDVQEQSFSGVTRLIDGLEVISNIDGHNVTVGVTPYYFEFYSSDPTVATVDETGLVTTIGSGTAEITASLNGIEAQGSLTLNSIGNFTSAPIPTHPAENVISIYSDAYQNVPVDFYNGYYAPYQTTTSNDFVVNGDNILNYENYNFVGIEFNQNVPTIDASEMSYIHFDIFVPNALEPGANIRFNLIDFGSDNSYGGGDDSSISTVISSNSTPPLQQGQWVSVDMDITGLANRSNLGQIIFDATSNDAPRPSNFYVDNIYLYNEGTPELPQLPINFDEEIDYNFTSFNGTSIEIVDNPFLTGANPSATKVGKLTNAGNNWEGFYADLGEAVDLNNANMELKMYSLVPVEVLMKFEVGANGAPDIQTTANHSGSGWEVLTFNFTSTDQYNRFVLFVDGPGNTAGEFFFDDIQLAN